VQEENAARRFVGNVGDWVGRRMRKRHDVSDDNFDSAGARGSSNLVDSLLFFVTRVNANEVKPIFVR
jgi:hypothetical protein